ncbi:ShlA/HecA/FhaA exofamily protein [Xenorhabdus sp. KJ12.1]|nr:ShlA/HecA/FhaA exofamily protein [Xenorhabdus sp. KJ12.1]
MNVSHNPGLFIRLTSYSLIYLVGIYPVSTSFANALVPDNNQTQVHSSNGVPVINIATPNGAGVSHNTYHDFNIGEKGAVLNNATAAAQSQLAGQLQKNSNFTDKAANLIVNEVTGNNASHLQGMLEVAGNKASVIVANPNGITCADCGFINMADATLTTGKPVFDTQGALDALQVTTDKILKIENLKGKGADALKLVSRGSSEMNNLEANDLSIILGANKISYKDGSIVAIPGMDIPDRNIREAFNIGGNVYQGMYANRIRIVSTEIPGLQLENLESTTDDISIDSIGKIALIKSIKAKRDLNVKSSWIRTQHMFGGSYPNLTNLEAGRDINLNGDVQNHAKTIIANRNINITGSFRGVVYGKHDVNPLMQAGDNITIQKNPQGDKVNFVSNRGINIKTLKGDVTINAEKFSNSSNLDNPYPFNIKIDMYGNIESGKSIYINSDEIVNNFARIKAMNDLILTGDTLDFIWSVPEPFLTEAKSDVNLIRPALIAGNNLVANLNDRININIDKDLKLTPKVSEDPIVSGNTVLLSAGDISLSNKIIANKDLVVTAKHNINLMDEDLKSQQGNVLIKKEHDTLIVSDSAKTKIKTINNIPVVNIATPNSSGISHNTYKNFYVSSEGAVLNNALNDTHSQLVGKLEKNPNLSDRSSRLIINEVTSGNESKLTGQLEIAGGKASVMIANPNGITCDGCGFINADQAVITTGKPIFDEKGALESLSVTTGIVNVLLKGLSGRETNTLDIISRSLSSGGNITANNISLIQGNNKISYKDSSITMQEPSFSHNDNNNDRKINVYNGGIQANKIRVLSTGKGKVALKDLESTKEDIAINVNDSIYLDGEIKSNGDINITSDIGIQNGGNIYSVNGDVNLSAKEEKIWNSGGKIKSEGNMRIFTSELNNTGIIQAKNNMWIQKNDKGDKTNEFINTGNKIKTLLGDLIIRTKKLTNGYILTSNSTELSHGNIESGSNLYIDSDKLINQKSHIKANNNAILSGQKLEHHQQLIVENGWHLPHKEKVGSITAGNTLEADFINTINIKTGKPENNTSGISAEKIILKSNKINISDFNGIKAKKESTFIENGIVKLPKDLVNEDDDNAPILPDNTQTKVKVINNIPVINISPPTPLGISHNTYKNFNINSEGVVLNNALMDTNSLLVGRLEKNPNFSNQSSRLIINEVTSRNRSHLMGQLEVAGDKASILIANPNGITCDGCGFINTEQGIIATGKPTFDEKGALESLKVNVGDIDILSGGLNGKEVSTLDIISASLLLNGMIIAKDISLIQGSNDINYKNGTIEKTKSPYNVFFGRILSDKAGGIHADKISILSNGSHDITLGSLEATKGGIEIKSSDSIKINNNIKSNGNVNVVANGSISIGDNTTIHSVNGDVNLFSTMLGMVETYIDGKKLFKEGGIHNKGSIKSEGDVRLFSQDFINAEKGTVQAKNNMWIQKNIKDDESDKIKNEGGEIKTLLGNLIIRAKSLHNMIVLDKINEKLTTRENLNISSEEIKTTAKSNIQAGKDITLAADTLSNSGKISAEKDMNLFVVNRLDNLNNALIQAGKSVTLATDILNNIGNISAEEDMHLFVNRLYNHNNALIQANNNLWLQKDAQGNVAEYLENLSATLKTHHGDIFIRTKVLNNNENAILSSGVHAYINATDLNNINGKLTARENLNISSEEIKISPKSNIQAGEDMTLAADKLFNRGNISAEKDMRLFVNRLYNQPNALIQANNNLWLQKDAQGNATEYIDNHSADLKTHHGDMFIRTKVLDNKQNAILSSGAHAYINATDLNHFIAKITSGKNLILTGENYESTGGMHSAGLNILADFGKHFNLVDHVNLNMRSGNASISAQNILLKSPKILIKHYDSNQKGERLLLNAEKDFSAISDEELIIKRGELSVKGNVMLAGKKTLHLEETTISGENVDLTTNQFFSGSSNNIQARNHLGAIALNGIDIDSKTVLKGKDITLFSPNSFISISNNQSIIADNNLQLRAKDEINSPNGELKGNNIELFSKENLISFHGANIFAKNNLKMFANKGMVARTLQANNISLNTDSFINIIRADATKNLSVTADELYTGSQWKGENVEFYFPKNDFVLRPSSIPISAKNLTISAGNNLTVPEKLPNDYHNITLIAGRSIYAEPSKYSVFLAYGEPLLVTSGNIKLLAGQDIFASNLNLNAGQEITLSAGRDIVMDAYVDNEFNILRDEEGAYIRAGAAKFIAGDHLQLSAGGDILARSASLTSKAGNILINTGRNLELTAFGYGDKNGDRDSIHHLHLPSRLNAAQNLTLVANGDLSTSGVNLTSGRDMTITTGGNIRFESTQEFYKAGKVENVTQHPSQLKSGGTLTMNSQGSILFQATSLIAKGVMDIAAKGGFLYAQAMNESYRWEETKKECKRVLGIKSCRIFGSKTETRRKESSTHKPTEFIAGGEINLMAKDDVTLEASRIETNKNAKITSQTGRVNFKAMPNTFFEQTLSTSKGFFITHRDKGNDEKIWVIPSVRVGGTLTIDAAKGISADAKIKEGQTLENVLVTLGSTPGTEWLKDLNQRQDVQWNLVKDAYSHWDKTSEQLNPVAGAVIAIAVAAVTAGSGLAAWAGNAAAGATGATGATASAVYGAAYGGMIGLTSQAAVALVENKGNLSNTLKALAKSDSVKSLVTRMAVGGALGGLDHVMGWGKVVEETGFVDPVEVQLPLLNHGWGEAARRVAAHSIVSSTLGTTINGGSFADNLRAELLNNLGSQVHAYGAGLIGDNGQILTHTGKAVSHAVLSGLVAEITGGDAKGAAAGALAAELAAISLGENTIKAEEWGRAANTQAQIARVLGGVAGAVFTGEAGGVYSGATAAENTFRYNYLAHHQKALRDKELAAESDALKKGLIHIKWGLTSANQDGAALAGFVAGVPVELYDTAVAIVGAAVNYQETLQALKHLISSDSILNTVYQAEKADIIKRLDLIERDYEKAGVDGAFNAGVEAGKLTTKVIGYLAVAKGGASVVGNVGSKFKGLKNTQGIVDIRNVVRLEKDGSKTAMSWTEGNYRQGYPFEDFVGKELKLPESARLPYGSETFDYFNRATGQAISVKTLNTTTVSRLQNPSQISNQLNGYINEVAKFERTTKGADELRITNNMIQQKTIHLAVPEKTTPTQWAEINKSISYAADNNIDIKVTVVRGDVP